MLDGVFCADMPMDSWCGVGDTLEAVARLEAARIQGRSERDMLHVFLLDVKRRWGDEEDQIGNLRRPGDYCMYNKRPILSTDRATSHRRRRLIRICRQLMSSGNKFISARFVVTQI